VEKTHSFSINSFHPSDMVILCIRMHYNLNLQSISINGQPLPISSQVFATSSNRGTIIDSGTTLAYLAEEAYDPFVNAVSYYWWRRHSFI